MASEEDLRVAREITCSIRYLREKGRGLLLTSIATALTAARAEGHRVAFQAGWDEGFQEAQLPDRFPHQNRCEVRYRERFPTNQGDKVFSREDEQRDQGR